MLNAARGASKRLLLTRLGGGVFGNDNKWIYDAMLRALRLAGAHDLDVIVVSYGRPTPCLTAFVQRSGFMPENATIRRARKGHRASADVRPKLTAVKRSDRAPYGSPIAFRFQMEL